MAHKAFDIIGERVLVVDPTYRNKEGIFQESRHYQTTAEGAPRPALDFIEPIYNPNPNIEKFAKGLDPRERVHSENPILSLHLGVDHLKLHYRGQRAGAHVFEGELNYVQGTFLNDGNFEVFDKYRDALRNAGFDVK